MTKKHILKYVKIKQSQKKSVKEQTKLNGRKNTEIKLKTKTKKLNQRKEQNLKIKS